MSIRHYRGPLREVRHRSLRQHRGVGALYHESLECGHSIEETPGDKSLGKPAKRRRCYQCKDQEPGDGV